MIKFFSSLSIIVILSLSACGFNNERVDGNGQITTEKRAVIDIQKIEVSGGINVVVDNGLASAKVEGDENIVPLIITETKGDKLNIRTKNNVNIHPSKPVTVYLSLPILSEIKVTGSANVTTNGKFSNSDKMSLEVTGSGVITMIVNAPVIQTAITGSGTINLSGETRNLNTEITGSGTFEGPDLKSENADVHIAGSGNALVNADNTLKASIEGSGEIKYKGNATVEKHVAGSGEVTKMQ